MTCQELSRVLSERQLAALPPELRAQADAHLAGCPGCRSLVETVERFNRMPVPQSLFKLEEIVPVRPMPSRSLFIAIAFIVPLMLAAIVVYWNGAGGWKGMQPESEALFIIVAAAGLAALALGFYRQFKPGAREPIDGRAMIAVLLLGFVAYATIEFGWRPPDMHQAVTWAWSCLRFGTIVALGTSLALLTWARLGFAANPRSASFWTGALASMAGLIALGLHCSNRELSHVLLGHATVILLAGYLIAWMARRFFGLR